MRTDELTDGHTPVLLEEVVAGLKIQPAGRYIDCTYGRGGHSAAILERLDSSGWLLAFDRDPEAVASAHRRFGRDRRFRIVHGSYTLLDSVVAEAGLSGMIDGVLLDLGVSSPQLEDPARGFGFMQDGALDMRMDPTQGMAVAEWLNTASAAEIERVLREFGEEPHARHIARAIIAARQRQPITRTRQLAELVAASVPPVRDHKHPATLTFQALRIFINRELEELRAVLPHTVRALAPGGRLVVISFHSLEDRMVKRFLRAEARGDDYPPDLPVLDAALKPRLRIIGKARRPSAEEMERNPRSRSAVLRVAEKIAA
jgi:16S rRNA (cytosine1402-N4)-methyltransferase